MLTAFFAFYSFIVVFVFITACSAIAAMPVSAMARMTVMTAIIMTCIIADRSAMMHTTTARAPAMPAGCRL
jgi:hypothetical protein